MFITRYSSFVISLQGKSGLATRRMVELMTDGTPKVAVLGPTLSAQLTVVGQVTPFYNVLQVITMYKVIRVTILIS